MSGTVKTKLSENNAASTTFRPRTNVAASNVQDAIEAVADAVSAEDLDFTGDTGTGAVDLDTQTLNVVTTNDSLTTTASGNTLTVALADVLEDIDTLGPSTADGEFLVATGAGALAWESGATARASMGVYSTAETDAAIAAAVTAEDLDFAGDTGTGAVDLDSQSLTIAGGDGITTSAAAQTATIDVDATVARYSTLASTANGQGASLIGVEDGGGLITATTVEGALAENRSAIDAIEAQVVATRTALKALDTTSAPVAYLTEAGRTGRFVWRSGDYSAEVAADTLEGRYIKADAIATTVGAWVRHVDGSIDPRWYGAAADGVTNDVAAIQAAINEAGDGRTRQWVDLGGLKYAINTPLVLNTSRTGIRNGMLEAIDPFVSDGSTDGGDKAMLRCRTGLRISVERIEFLCNSVADGIICETGGFGNVYQNCEIFNLLNFGIRTKATTASDQRIESCMVTGNATPSLRTGVAIDIQQGDCILSNTIARYTANEVLRVTANTLLCVGCHFYNGYSGADAGEKALVYNAPLIRIAGGFGQTFNDNYFDNGQIILEDFFSTHWIGNRYITESDGSNADAYFVFDAVNTAHTEFPRTWIHTSGYATAPVTTGVMPFMKFVASGTGSWPASMTNLANALNTAKGVPISYGMGRFEIITADADGNSRVFYFSEGDARITYDAPGVANPIAFYLDAADEDLKYEMVSGQAIVPATTLQGQLGQTTERWQGVYGGDGNFNRTIFPEVSELTIATGAVTVTGTRHVIDTEGDAATDDLDTINGGVDGQLLILTSADATRNVIVKDGTGNIQCGSDFTLNNRAASITLMYIAATSTWVRIASSTN